jgi:molybdenum cofactor synthesis domain
MIRDYISLDEALKIGKEAKYELDMEDRIFEINTQYAVGKLSAEEVLSPKDYPAENKSAVDGYALNSKYILSASSSNPISLKIIGRSEPDNPFDGVLRDDETVRILTGAKLPQGADSILMDEDAIVEGEYLKVNKNLRPFQNVSFIGEDIKKGERIISRGEIISPAKLVALLETGIRNIKILDLKIGILSTGNELLSGKVKNTTQYLLIETLKKYGYNPINLGIAADDYEDLISKLSKEKTDVLILTGGTGPSENDLTSEFVKSTGKILFHGIKMRPGRTTGLGIIDGTPVFIISGLPVASLMALENVIDPLIRYWFNLEPIRDQFVKAKLNRAVVNTLGFRSFVRVKLNENYEAEPLKVTGSGVISSIINADGILIVPENVEGYSEGEEVNIKLLRC